MKRLPLAISLVALSGFAGLHAQEKAPLAPAPSTATTAPASPAPPAVKLPPQKPDVAAPKLDKEGNPQAAFMASHERFLKIAKEGKTDLLFLGDSITAGWGGSGQKPIWEQTFGAYQPANFGIGGDRTQHVLWRIENGELEGIKPKLAVLMIGTNNSSSDAPDGVARGVTKIVETLRAKLPATKVLLLGIFPRGEKTNRQRENNAAVNTAIAKLDDGKKVFYLDIGEKFLQPDGTLTKEIMPDFLHLSPKGYQIWADAIAPKVAELCK